ncbi:MAG: 30S ribosomal protein S6 [Chloroflexi bacterium]|nr:30S ribosomal protein S6 [Chloroflexota bacterium]
MKRAYEIPYVVPTGIPDAEQKGIIEKVAHWLTDAGGEIKNTNHWGRRRLAYPIGTNREGYYVLLEVEIEPKAVDEFQRKMNIEANILRYLVVRKDE